jgi:hypothetical protein
MIAGRVVGDGEAVGLPRMREEQVGLGGVQVAAAGVHAERPGREARGLPGGEREGVEEQRGEGVDGERLRRRGRGVEEGRVRDGGDRRRIGERQLRGGAEAEEGVGLVGPVEAARTARVAGGGTVLGAAVVVRGRGGGGGGRGANGGGHGDTTQGGEREAAARA